MQKTKSEFKFYRNDKYGNSEINTKQLCVIITTSTWWTRKTIFNGVRSIERVVRSWKARKESKSITVTTLVTNTWRRSWTRLTRSTAVKYWFVMIEASNCSVKSSLCKKKQEEGIPVGCVPSAFQPYMFWWSPLGVSTKGCRYIPWDLGYPSP